VYSFDLSRVTKSVANQLIKENILVDVLTPSYTTSPYIYPYMAMIFGRRMNLFNMWVSDAIFLEMELNIQRWIHARKYDSQRLNWNQLWLTPSTRDMHNVKLQMCIKPDYYFWVIETLLLNKSVLDSYGLATFKMLYMLGELKNNDLSEMFPDHDDKTDVMTYTFNDKLYKRELLNAPNIVFYLTQDANIEGLVDTLCKLFPNKFNLSLGVPRFNTRLNNNVYISFGGNNEDKFTMDSLHVPDEYTTILQSKNPHVWELSELFSGHTLVNMDGTPNAILSYAKLISKGTSFKSLYTQYKLNKYYDEIFGDPMFQSKRGGYKRGSRKSVKHKRNTRKKPIRTRRG